MNYVDRNSPKQSIINNVVQLERTTILTQPMTKFVKGGRSEKNGEELSGLDFVPEGLLPAMLYSPARRTKWCQHNQYPCKIGNQGGKVLESPECQKRCIYISYCFLLNPKIIIAELSSEWD